MTSLNKNYAFYYLLVDIHYHPESYEGEQYKDLHTLLYFIHVVAQFEVPYIKEPHENIPDVFCQTYVSQTELDALIQKSQKSD